MKNFWIGFKDVFDAQIMGQLCAAGILAMIGVFLLGIVSGLILMSIQGVFS